MFNFLTSKNRTPKPTSTTFDSFDREFKDTTSCIVNLGNKLEVSKTLGNCMQLTSSITKYSKQYFMTFFTTHDSLNPSTILQVGFEPNGSYQLKLRKVFSRMCSNGAISYHGVVSDRREVFSTINLTLNRLTYNLSLKAIKPVFEMSNLVYIFNYWKEFGRVGCGMEVVSVNNRLGLGVSGRYATANSVTCVNMQKFNLLRVNYYRRLSSILDAGVEVQSNIRERTRTFLAGMRLKRNRSEIKWNINSGFLMNFSWDEEISNKIRVGVSGEYNLVDFEYGITMIYDN